MRAIMALPCAKLSHPLSHLDARTSMGAARPHVPPPTWAPGQGSAPPVRPRAGTSPGHGSSRLLARPAASAGDSGAVARARFPWLMSGRVCLIPRQYVAQAPRRFCPSQGGIPGSSLEAAGTGGGPALVEGSGNELANLEAFDRGSAEWDA